VELLCGLQYPLERHDLAEVVRHAILAPLVISITVGGKLLPGITGSLISLLGVLNEHSTQVPDTPGTPAQVGPDIIDVKMVQARLSHPPENLHDVRGHHDRLRNIFPAAVVRVSEPGATHALNPGD